MRCLHHPLNQVVGYCSVCGDFGCSECMTEYESALYCRRCFKPIAEQLERQKKQEEALARRERQRLVVHTKQGRIACGVCFAMNIASEGFHLDLVDHHGHPRGKATHVVFANLKAVFYVKSFDGKFDPDQAYREWHPEGTAMVVEFQDSEVIQGSTIHPFRQAEPRFHLIPQDPDSNNISILVERTALTQIYTPEEYRREYHRQIEDFLKRHRALNLPKEEGLGDFYFERHDYARSIKHYRVALGEVADPLRIRKKIASAQYNIGVRHIKNHDYRQALSCMDQVLETDPDNERARRKIQQLKHALKKRYAEAGLTAQ